MTFLSFALALLIDWRWSWPEAFLARVGHPVIWIGRAITLLERGLNQGSERRRFLSGALVSLVLVLSAATAGVLFEALIMTLSGTGVVTACVIGIVAWPLLASRSLYVHVDAVRCALRDEGLDGGRRELSKVVGRDPQNLDADAIRRAAIETLAENTSDGVIAPLFWGLCLGLPGILAYKTINTLDSMIGYRNARYLYFGRFAARLDDVANWLPARGTALLFALTNRRIRPLWSLRAEARQHRSPNAGWPETVMARLIDVRLSGPRHYDTGPSEDAWLNGRAPDPDTASFDQALMIYVHLIRCLITGLWLMASVALLVRSLPH